MKTVATLLILLSSLSLFAKDYTCAPCDINPTVVYCIDEESVSINSSVTVSETNTTKVGSNYQLEFKIDLFPSGKKRIKQKIKNIYVTDGKNKFYPENKKDFNFYTQKVFKVQFILEKKFFSKNWALIVNRHKFCFKKI